MFFLDKILEARRDFDEALSKLKGGRRKRDTDSDSVVIHNIPLERFLYLSYIELR